MYVIGRNFIKDLQTRLQDFQKIRLKIYTVRSHKTPLYQSQAWALVTQEA